jgi:sigma-B regulation protein RsbU (phosphoserine phosphatase)
VGSPPFGSGDVLVLYTEGIVDATNEKHERYGFKRLEESLTRHRSVASVDEFSQALLADSGGGVTGKETADDFSLLFVRMHSEGMKSCAPVS